MSRTAIASLSKATATRKRMRLLSSEALTTPCGKLCRERQGAANPKRPQPQPCCVACIFKHAFHFGHRNLEGSQCPSTIFCHFIAGSHQIVKSRRISPRKNIIAVPLVSPFRLTEGDGNGTEPEWNGAHLRPQVFDLKGSVTCSAESSLLPLRPLPFNLLPLRQSPFKPFQSKGLLGCWVQCAGCGILRGALTLSKPCLAISFCGSSSSARSYHFFASSHSCNSSLA